MEINDRFDDENISCDILWLDIQHTNGKRYFTWDPQNYPNPGEMLDHVATASGRSIVAIVDPHIKVDSSYYVYSESLAGDFFVKKNSADMKPFQGDCWPGTSSYLDVTRSDVRAYWATLFNYNKYVGSRPNLWIWNDMNEPSVFNGPEMSFPRDAIHGTGVEHRDVHNMYGIYYHRSTFEGLLARDDQPRRPFVLSRSFFVGSHRYGPIWTGDNAAEWSHLKISVPMLLSLSVAGMSFSGADVGGFFGDPSKELYIRWQQTAAAMYPFFRCHVHLDNKYREPWTFDAETTRLVREAIDMRYQLLPYWYTLFAEYAMEGLPIIRPIWFDDLSSATNPLVEEEVLVGSKILVRPILEKGVDSVDVFFPGDSSTIWYPYSGYSSAGDHYTGGSKISYRVGLGTIPIFVKAGSIIPMKLTKRKSSLLMRNDPYSVRVFPDNNGYAEGMLHVDDEEGMGYRSGDYARVKLMYHRGEFRYEKISGKRGIDNLVFSDVINGKGGLPSRRNILDSDTISAFALIPGMFNDL